MIPTADPFLFCVHHEDAYPAGNDQLGPATSLAGREIGMDFAGKDGWRMYHGDAVPGFPQHPHRGFETVTIVRKGFIDHSDSLGATARFGAGDVQWLTAGRGINHCEMFPLLRPDAPNPLELFQIWLNLPAASKLVAPYFSMFWAHQIPSVDPAPGVRVTLVAGALDGTAPPTPPPDSWAARPEADLAIWTIALAPGATWTVPPARAGTNRTLRTIHGPTVRIDGDTIAARGGGEVLLLQGRAIGEPVAAHGPFVMNTPREIHDAITDYRRTRFGGWPWPVDDPVHPRTEGRFARYPDGRVERP
jgi:hypothetical protein